MLLLVVYLVVCEFASRRTRQTLAANAETKTTLVPLTELQRIDCGSRKIFCSNDTDCREICGDGGIDNDLLTQYKCSAIKTCTQTLMTGPDETTQQPISCDRSRGFYPILIFDEILPPRWKCLNTLPQIFDDTRQDYHSYICNGGQRQDLELTRLFDSCQCPANKVKVRDEFRNNIPICIDKDQLSLFPNFVTAATTTSS